MPHVVVYYIRLLPHVCTVSTDSRTARWPAVRRAAPIYIDRP